MIAQVTPLHIELALHYHTTTGQHPRLSLAVVRQYAEDLAGAGLLEATTAEDPAGEGFTRTDGLAVWVNALCATPLPVQRWVMPDREGRAA